MCNNADTLECLFRFIESNCSNLRNTLRDRFSSLSSKSESEMGVVLEMCYTQMEKCQNRAVQQANLDMVKAFEQQRKEAQAATDSFKRDVVKIVRHEVDKRTSIIVKEQINVPGLIGEGQKYNTFHHCMLDFNRQVHKGLSDLRVEQVDLES